MDLFGEVIYSYTRKQAIEDGILVDVSDTAAEAGFKIPVALTARLQEIIENIPKGRNYQSYNGRLWDVLSMAYFAARVNGGKSTIYYDLYLDRIGEKGGIKRKIQLKMMISAGDDFEPVITIMLPDED
jgi:hypothetical protein